VEKFVLQLEAQLAERQVNIELSPEARDWLARTGYDSHMGARPLARIIQEHVKRPLADEVLFGKLSAGGTVRVVLETEDGKEKLAFKYLSREEEKASKPPKPPGSAKPRKPSPPSGSGDAPGGSGGVSNGPSGGSGGSGGGLVPRVSRKPRRSEPV
jgi:ATP-dependent Clp protease ATP-binding subunit ClpA